MEFYKKVFLQLSIVLSIVIFCLAQTELNAKSTIDSSTESKLLKSINDTFEGDIRDQQEASETATTTALPLFNYYTPLPIFPSDETKYTTNKTLIQQLLKLNENNSEIDDLVQYQESQENVNENNNQKINNKNENKDAGYVVENIEVENGSDNENDYGSDLDEDTDDIEIPKSETEWIETGENTEDDRSNVSVEIINETVNTSTLHYTIKSDYFGIFAGFFIIVGVIIYLSVTAWRRMIQQRYRQREMLVNEEEFYDPSDLKHFSI